MSRASAVTCTYLRRTFARVCDSDTDIGSVILRAPAAIAAPAPFASGTSAAAAASAAIQAF